MITRDALYIYCNGERVGVVVARNEGASAMADFLEFLDEARMPPHDGDDDEPPAPKPETCQHCRREP